MAQGEVALRAMMLSSIQGATSISTMGDFSSGIYAQSVGGGGGSGGSSTSLNATAGSTAVGAQATNGGSGSGGGDGGSVEVNSTRNVILTKGFTSYGIYAQSLGGGGGSGGDSISGSLTAGSTSISAGVNIGGSGASGGDASSVSVNSEDGRIKTLGDTSAAIFAQSLGGGGGAGGSAISISGTAGATGASATVNLGGTGGPGGSSDSVTVISTTNLHTKGNTSPGIFAQSVGGGGGAGGSTISGSLTLAAGTSVDAGVNLGGSGGVGGSAGAVEVNNQSGLIITRGNNSAGIYAQSPWRWRWCRWFINKHLRRDIR